MKNVIFMAITAAVVIGGLYYHSRPIEAIVAMFIGGAGMFVFITIILSLFGAKGGNTK